jgi:hypothetical protein
VNASTDFLTLLRPRKILGIPTTKDRNMTSEKVVKKEPWAARLHGGPFDGSLATLGIEPKGKLIRVWESILTNGYMHDERVDDLLPGDCIYEEESRSILPEGLKGVLRGGEYKFVRQEPGDIEDDEG